MKLLLGKLHCLLARRHLFGRPMLLHDGLVVSYAKQCARCGIYKPVRRRAK